MIDEADIAGISSADEGKSVALSLLNTCFLYEIAMDFMAFDIENAEYRDVNFMEYIEKARELLDEGLESA